MDTETPLPADTETPPPANTETPLPDILDLAKDPESQRQAEQSESRKAFETYAAEVGLAADAESIVVGADSQGNEVAMPTEDAGPLLYAMQQSGIPAAQGKNILGMVAALDHVRSERQMKQEAEVLQQIRKETVAEFGDGLVASARDMVAGGQRLFGAELWRDICEIQALVNDKRFIRALSAYGRSFRNDDGGPTNASPGTSASGGRLAFDLDFFGKGMK